MKIGILTYHRACNYGAFLQSCALCSRLNQEENIDAEIIDYRMQKEANMYSLDHWSLLDKLRFKKKYNFTKQVYDTFAKIDFSYAGMKLSRESIVSNNMDDFQKLVKDKYDVIIAGSDEIWKADSFRGFPTPYWLIGDLGCRKFACAVSARNDFSKLDDDKIDIMHKALNDFEFVSVRDEATYDEIRKHLNKDKILFKCCDPSFIYDFDVPNMDLSKVLEGKAILNPEKKNVVVMTEQPKIAAKIRKQLGKEYNLISLFHWHKGYISIPNLTPAQWLTVIKNADMVLASYFHAICFSIKMQVKFFALGSPGKSAKVKDLLSNSSLEQYYLDNAIQVLDNIDLKKVLNSEIDEKLYSAFIDNQSSKFKNLLENLQK